MATVAGLRASSRFDEKFMKNQIYERRQAGTACLTYDDGSMTAVTVMHECKQEKTVRRTQNSPRTIVDAARDDRIFITTRFAPGIILGTFPRELSGLARFCKPRSGESLQRK